MASMTVEVEGMPSTYLRGWSVGLTCWQVGLGRWVSHARRAGPSPLRSLSSYLLVYLLTYSLTYLLTALTVLSSAAARAASALRTQ